MRQIPNAVNDLKEKVLEYFALSSTCATFKVYASGTAVPVPTDATDLKPWDVVPRESTGPWQIIAVP